jgi:ferric-dicitrate binding protein FerR (iron transport regulator)
MDVAHSGPERKRLLSEAAAWFLEMRSSPILADCRIEFERWLGSDPRHRSVDVDMERWWEIARKAVLTAIKAN